jgi:hypothetical protein
VTLSVGRSCSGRRILGPRGVLFHLLAAAASVDVLIFDSSQKQIYELLIIMLHAAAPCYIQLFLPIGSVLQQPARLQSCQLLLSQASHTSFANRHLRSRYQCTLF